MRNETLLVGVTGGIGSGKSTVCRAFAGLGRMVISADRVARDLTENDETVRAGIRREFGPRVFSADGRLDRSALGRAAFADAGRTAALNAIVHPRVFEEIGDLLEAAPPEEKDPYVIIEAALIFESGMDELLHRVVVVDAPEEVRIRRVKERDRLTEEEIRKRIEAQMPVRVKLQRADFVIVNDRNSVALEAKVAFIDMVLRGLSPAVVPGRPQESAGLPVRPVTGDVQRTLPPPPLSGPRSS